MATSHAVDPVAASPAGSRLTQGELVRRAAAVTSLPIDKVKVVLATILDDIQTALAQGNKVVLPSFGTFEPRDKGDRMGRNPKTGEPIKIAKHRAVGFKAGTKLRRTVRE